MKRNGPNQSQQGRPSGVFSRWRTQRLLLFGHLQFEKAGFTAGSVEDILSEIRRIFEKIPKEILTARIGSLS
jgi:hypothetical protein